MSQPLARLVVCESSPRIAPLLRRFLPRIRIWEARSPALLDDLLRESPASFVVMAITADDGPALLPVIVQGVRRFPTSVWSVYGDANVRRQAEFIYSTGIQLVINSVTQIPALKRMVRRHFRRIVEPRLSLVEAIQARLPWHKQAIIK